MSDPMPRMSNDTPPQNDLIFMNMRRQKKRVIQLIRKLEEK